MKINEVLIYEKYKKSNVDWIGNIPVDWNTYPIGRLFKKIKRTCHIDEELLSVYRDYGVVLKSSRDDNFNRSSEDLNPYQLVEKNDLVINKMKTWQGSIAISNLRGIVSPAYHVYKPNRKYYKIAYPGYIHLLIRTPLYITQYMRRSKGIRVNQWDLDPDEFKCIELLLPDIETQKQIANFLDKEITRIDTLISKKQKQIELLKEKRQAIITQAVTKGLDKNVKMKDSGVEWIGEIPKHWELRKLKTSSKIFGRIGFRGYTTQDLVDEGKGPISLSPSNMRNGKIYLDKCTYLSWDKFYESPEIIVKINDVLIVKTGSTYGKTSFVDIDNTDMTINPQIAIFKNIKCLNKYLFYSLVPIYFQDQLDFSNAGSTIPTITQETLGNIKICLPSIKEQKDIVDYLDQESERIDILESKIIDSISLIKEYRSSLITNTVSGQIDIGKYEVSK